MNTQSVKEKAEFPPMFKNKYLAHALGGYNGLTYLNTENSLVNSIELGYKYFEVDLKRTTDNYVVLTHGWNKKKCAKFGMKYSAEFKKMTKELFLKQKIQGMPTADSSMLYKYMKKDPKFFLELDIHGSRDEEGMRLLIQSLINSFQNDTDVLNRCLVQIHTVEMYNWINNTYPFKYYQYFIPQGTTLEDASEILDICKELHICAVAIHVSDATDELLSMFHNESIAILVYTVDNSFTANRLFKAGADTVCTNTLSPASDLLNIREFSIAYSSNAVVENSFESLINNNVIKGSIAINSKGHTLFNESVLLRKYEKYSLMKPLFHNHNKKISGFRASCKFPDKSIRWYCTDGLWRTKEAFIEHGYDIRKNFSPQESVDLFSLKPEGTLTFVCMWENES